MKLSNLALRIMCRVTGEKDIPRVSAPVNALVWAAFIMIVVQLVILLVKIFS